MSDNIDFKYTRRLMEGDGWKRASSILIYNDYGQIPRVMFAEELVGEFGGEILRTPKGELDVFVDQATMAQQFPILDMDGNPTESFANVGQIALLLTSAYVYFAEQRDAALAASLLPPEVEEDPENPDQPESLVDPGIPPVDSED